MAKSDGRAFIIKEDKVEEFLSQKDKTKIDIALKRAEEHKNKKWLFTGIPPVNLSLIFFIFILTNNHQSVII